MSAYVDTSALYAVMDRDDGNHKRAGKIWNELLSGEEIPVVSNYVILETAALVQRRLGMSAVKVLFNDIVPVFAVEWITIDDHRSAVSAILAAGRRGLSLTDCASFELMRRLGLDTVFTFDRHFKEQGFSVIP
ncbi:MAG: PIN domain-containing protein [Deltaproteobacteria bacterium]|nr:PIN domain-containing protein [Deltaproteobacteria bacterium]